MISNVINPIDFHVLVTRDGEQVVVSLNETHQVERGEAGKFQQVGASVYTVEIRGEWAQVPESRWFTDRRQAEEAYRRSVDVGESAQAFQPLA